MLSWNTISFKHDEIHYYASQTSESYGGGASVDYGLFSFGADASWSENRERTQCETSILEVEIDMIQLPLIRLWWDPIIFKSRGWKWAPGTSSDLVSDGGQPPQIQGLMPLCYRRNFGEKRKS